MSQLPAAESSPSAARDSCERPDDAARAPRRSAFALPVHQLRRALADPRRLARLHYSSVVASLRSIVEPDDATFVCEEFGVDAATFRRLEADLLADVAFARCIERQWAGRRGTSIRLFGDDGAADHERGLRLLYYVTRLLRPAIAVETGVFDGFTSAVILKALRDGGAGRLCSIDLPARAAIPASTDKMRFDRLPDSLDPGWLVPDDLRARWTLRLGSSEALLPGWLAELGTIDLFFHDSLHTAANMLREFTLAWAALAPNGVLASDDVFWSTAFRRFGRRVGRRGRIMRGMGFLRKER
jgi:predicted O-methyltransferase YrrM